MHALLAVLYPHAPHIQGRCLVSEEEKKRVKEQLVKMPRLAECRTILDPILGAVFHNDDKILVLDVCRLLVDAERFTPELTEHIGNWPLSHYHQLTQAALQAQIFLQAQAKHSFLSHAFPQWRKAHFRLLERKAQRREAEKRIRAPLYRLSLRQREGIFPNLLANLPPQPNATVRVSKGQRGNA